MGSGFCVYDTLSGRLVTQKQGAHYSDIICVCVLFQRYLFAAVGSGFCVYDTLSGRLVTQKQGAHYSKVLHLQFVYDG